MLLHSARTRIRLWHRHDDEQAIAWPPYHDPFEPLWNLSRASGGDAWYNTYDWNNERRMWAVEDLAGRVMGRISLREVDQGHTQARLGITFGAPYVGRGFGTEALAAFLDYYFGDMGFRIMVLDVAAPNERAVRSYERLGFQHVGTDWRIATSTFDRAVLQQPRHASLRRFFREDHQRLYVLFYEMTLGKPAWQAQRQHVPPGGG